MAATDLYHVVGSLSPSRKAARFIGGNVDDYIQVDAFAVARTAANDAVGSVSAWIMVPDITGTYCILCLGDNNAVEFLEFNVEAGKLASRATDATTAQYVSITSDVVIKPHRWTHVSFVQRADGAGVQIYVNGVLVPSSNTTATDVNSWITELDGLDTARIGAANKAGDASVTNEFKGFISDVKYWSVALTATQVLEDYQGKTNTTSLESHWDFDDDYIDNGLGADNATVVGDIVLCNAVSEFTSRLCTMTGAASPVVADTILFAISNGEGHAVVKKAA